MELDPAFEYTWNPTLLNFCLNDSCSEVSFAPQSNINFIIQAQDEEGCLDTINLNIIVNDTLAADTTIAFICPGDSIFWEGNWYDEVGTYCIELDQDSLCQNQTCLQVFYYAEEPLEIIASDTILVAGDFVEPAHGAESVGPGDVVVVADHIAEAEAAAANAAVVAADNTEAD